MELSRGHGQKKHAQLNGNQAADAPTWQKKIEKHITHNSHAEVFADPAPSQPM